MFIQMLYSFRVSYPPKSTVDQIQPVVCLHAKHTHLAITLWPSRLNGALNNSVQPCTFSFFPLLLGSIGLFNKAWKLVFIFLHVPGQIATNYHKRPESRKHLTNTQRRLVNGRHADMQTETREEKREKGLTGYAHGGMRDRLLLWPLSFRPFQCRCRRWLLVSGSQSKLVFEYVCLSVCRYPPLTIHLPPSKSLRETPVEK